MQTIALDDFPLKWRWTNPSYSLLTDDELSLIEPLGIEDAKILWDKSLAFISKEHEYSPNREIFEQIDGISCDNENELEAWLTEKLQSERIFVSWHSDAAVIVNTRLFIKYWDDFCYPSSDDVSIWPLNEKWVVHYWHYEVFCYGKTKCL